MESIDMNELEDRVNEQLARQKKIVPGVLFVVGLAMFLLFTLISFTMASAQPGAALFMALMGGSMGLLMSGLGLMISSGLSDKSLRAQLITRAMAEMMSERRSDKRKNTSQRLMDTEPEEQDGEIVMLGDDGELKRVRRS